MEEKTVLSREFSSPDAEPATDLACEFNRPADDTGEFNDGCRDLEFLPAEPEKASPQQTGRRRRRSLLMQVAAAGVTAAAAVGIYMAANPYLCHCKGWLDITDRNDSIVYPLWSHADDVGSTDYTPLSGVRYDPDSNTLYLTDCEIGKVSYHTMSRTDAPFSIHVDGHVQVLGIAAFGSARIADNLPITGTPGSTLSINTYPDFRTAVGLHIRGSSTVEVGPGITVEIGGTEDIVRFEDTTAESPFLYDLRATAFSGTLLSGDFFREEETFVQDYPDWKIPVNGGTPAVFSPR